MPRVCVLLADGFEEIEAVTVIDVLRRAEVEVVTLGVTGDEVRGSHDVVLRADGILNDHADGEWDVVILPGGLPGSTNLRDHPAVQELIRRQNARAGRIAAICAAPIALAAAGVLEGKRVTSYPGLEDQLPGASYREENVVADGNVVTSRGVDTALEFALKLVGDLRGAKVAESLRKGMLVSP